MGCREMVIRHMAAGFMEAERGFRRVPGYMQMPYLTAALKTATSSSKQQHAEVAM